MFTWGISSWIMADRAASTPAKNLLHSTMNCASTRNTPHTRKSHWWRVSTSCLITWRWVYSSICPAKRKKAAVFSKILPPDKTSNIQYYRSSMLGTRNMLHVVDERGGGGGYQPTYLGSRIGCNHPPHLPASLETNQHSLWDTWKPHSNQRAEVHAGRFIPQV